MRKSIESGEGRVSAVYAQQIGISPVDCLFIAHSVKSSMNSRLVSYFHSGLAAHGFLTVKFNFPYAEGRLRLARKPDRTEVLVDCYERVVEETRKSEWKPENLFVGGISMGAAVSSHVVADGPEISGLKGLFFLSYPLHRPGDPDILGDTHLHKILQPMIFVAGTKDPNAEPKAPEISRIKAGIKDANSLGRRSGSEIQQTQGQRHLFEDPTRNSSDIIPMDKIKQITYRIDPLHPTTGSDFREQRLLLTAVLPGSDADKYRSIVPPIFREKMSKSASTSFVFANAKGELGHIVSQLKRVTNVESVTPVTGRFDLVIRLKTNEPTKAFNTVEKIRTINGITSTQTAFSIENVTNAKNREESSEPPLAYALVKVKGKFRTVLQKLKSFPNLVEAHLIPGEFDVVASFNGFSQDELMENSVEKISRINGVTASETLIAWTPTNQP